MTKSSRLACPAALVHNEPGLPSSLSRTIKGVQSGSRVPSYSLPSSISMDARMFSGRAPGPKSNRIREGNRGKGDENRFHRYRRHRQDFDDSSNWETSVFRSWSLFPARFSKSGDGRKRTSGRRPRSRSGNFRRPSLIESCFRRRAWRTSSATGRYWITSLTAFSGRAAALPSRRQEKCLP